MDRQKERKERRRGGGFIFFLGQIRGRTLKTDCRTLRSLWRVDERIQYHEGGGRGEGGLAGWLAGWMTLGVIIQTNLLLIADYIDCFVFNYLLLVKSIERYDKRGWTRT